MSVTKTVMHSSKYLNKGKLELLRTVDENVLVLKNEASAFVHSHILELLDTGVLTFANKYYKQYRSEYLTAWEIQTLFIEICRLYKAASDRLFKNARFEVQKSVHKTYYKKNTPKHKAGDLKEYWIVRKPSSLSGLLKYLVRVRRFDNITNRDILYRLNSYGEEKRGKILRYAQLRQEAILAKLSPIEFRTGTYTKFGYTTGSKKSAPCFTVDESNRKYKHWYIYKIRDRYIYIPLQIDKKYHKDCEVKRQCKVSVRGNRVIIYAPTQADEPVFNDVGETVGVDVNVVNNFITASDGHVMDYDREYLSQMFKMVAKIDKIGYGKLSSSQLRRYRKIIRRNEWYFRRLIHDFLTYCVQNNIVNVVMEDLRSFDGTYLRDKETGIKYSRIVRLLRLSNVKNWLLTQAEKLGIRVHLTPSHYTSQQCPVCGNIDKENRQTQEEFRCVNCGHEANADYNASVNIKHRFTVNVLRDSKLHTFDGYGRMRPLTHNKYVVRRILEESAACT